ncbi:cytochrome c biogenesis protein ResB [Aureibacillus halotolerans]|uniref:Cytochrome c biogenesis protein n=1 Tax=Aureibacillus halotolerans TaxID=1508390 RepID=A0A4R6U734_9BACI|nr:cytochrome c biogenesis protein ResB [Aureibacillus halotolerans]TDQ41576.1 cytochrome c biogenesis protein [Aureibacillus halotolerans]
MQKVKCECGHVNPIGTNLCEACGRPLTEEERNRMVAEMRYEGTARRSQTYKRSLVDRIWNYFSSVKVGVWLIFVTLIISSLGTIFPQEMYLPPGSTEETYYKDEFGIAGQIFYQLGFHNMYGQWWYILLVGSIGISLVICSLDRFVPLYRALKHQRVMKADHFLKHQRLFSTTKTSSFSMDEMKRSLEKKRYRVRTDGDYLLAEKGRFSRWGPYVNHIGLILFLIGVMLRFFPAMYVEDSLWVREYETEPIPHTDGYFLENKNFEVIYYDEEDNEGLYEEALDRVGGGVVKSYQTEAVVYKRAEGSIPGSEPDLEKVKEELIRVNQPLEVDGLKLYQMNYKPAELYRLTLSLNSVTTGESVGEFTINLGDEAIHTNEEVVYPLNNGYEATLVGYYPDYQVEEVWVDGERTIKLGTRSKIPDNPVFVFETTGPSIEGVERSVIGIGINVASPDADNQFELSLVAPEFREATGLTVQRDRTLGILLVGGIIFMIGVIQGMYWTHRRVWVKKDGEMVWVSAHTNKNWFGFKKELEQVTEQHSLLTAADRTEEKENDTFSEEGKKETWRS